MLRSQGKAVESEFHVLIEKNVRDHAPPFSQTNAIMPAGIA